MQFWTRGRPGARVRAQIANLDAPESQKAEKSSECNSGRADAQERKFALTPWCQMALSGTRTIHRVVGITFNLEQLNTSDFLPQAARDLLRKHTLNSIAPATEDPRAPSTRGPRGNPQPPVSAPTSSCGAARCVRQGHLLHQESTRHVRQAFLSIIGT